MSTRRLLHKDKLLKRTAGSAGSEWFCTLDPASGYWQVAMDDAGKSKTAFATHQGLFHFIIMPFELCNALAVMMQNIRSDIGKLVLE